MVCRGPRCWSAPDRVIASAREAVDWRKILIEPDAIRTGGDQRITLNGLGQGYVTDRVADLLYSQGLRHVLVDLGEQRAVGPRRGAPWLIARAGAAPFALTDGALATSEGTGCVLGASGAAHHLFDPRNGRSASHWKKITVHRRSAAVADALSDRALYVASGDEMEALLPRLAGTVIWTTDRDGRQRQWTSPAADTTAG